MHDKTKFSLSYYCYKFVLFTVSMLFIASSFIVFFYTIKSEWATIGFQFGFMLLFSAELFKIHWKRFFANIHPELFDVPPIQYDDIYDENQRSSVNGYIICIAIGTLYLLLQEKWLILLCFIALSVINLILEIYIMDAGDCIITKKELEKLGRNL
ncbi:MAG: hypothetical protein ACLS4B_03850 [Roseburia faecis]|jgi:hypothetical protein